MPRTETAWKMMEWGKTIAVDLIRWIFLFYDSPKMRQPRTESPKILLDIPLTVAILVPARARERRRLSRGPTSLNRRSNF